MPRIVTAVLAAGLLLTAGCGAGNADVPDDVQVTVPLVEGTHVSGTASGPVTVALGERLVVDLGKRNASIGDAWFLVTPPDPAILADAGDHYVPDCDRPGCGADTTWHFSTVGAGTTAVTFQYCYRSRPPACEPMPDRGPATPVTLTVTVTRPG